MDIPPEIRQRIYDEERIRIEARERLREEMLLRQQRASLGTRVFMLLLVFGVGYAVSHYYARFQAVPDVAPPVAAVPQVSQAILGEITQALKPPVQADVCVHATGGVRPQIKATIELARNTSLEMAKRMAVANAKIVGAILRQHGLVVPAYVEVFSPGRWYGLALYDSENLKITWDVCPGRCEEEGTQRVKRCPE